MTEPRRYAHPAIANEPPIVVRMDMSADDYLAMSATSQPQNLIDGLVYVSPPPTEVHEDTVSAIAAALRAYARQHGGYVIRSPFDCRLNDTTVIQPDAAYVAAARVHLVGGYMQGAPELVVEVVCPGTFAFDSEAKLAAYARNGVREAWLVDPDAERVTVFSGDGSAWASERAVLFGEAIPSDIVEIGAARLAREAE